VDAILEAAARVFAEQGFAGGTTNRIAERAGVSVGSLYEYFPNKESILVALVERTTERGMARIEQRLAEDSAGGGHLDRLLLGFVEALLAFHRCEPELHRVLFEEAPHPPELHACVPPWRASWPAAPRWVCAIRTRPLTSWCRSSRL
jgi:AcrR family transcriptional regulator